jgi:hypothetical protein
MTIYMFVTATDSLINIILDIVHSTYTTFEEMALLSSWDQWLSLYLEIIIIIIQII